MDSLIIVGAGLPIFLLQHMWYSEHVKCFPITRGPPGYHPLPHQQVHQRGSAQVHNKPGGYEELCGLVMQRDKYLQIQYGTCQKFAMSCQGK